MTTTERVAAEVLAEHRWSVRGDGGGRCGCGETFGWLGEQSLAAHRAHLASVLAARLDDGLAAKVSELADEWEDCGDEDCADGCWFVRKLRALLDQPHTGTNP